MATGIQTGLRTGSAMAPAGKPGGPSGGLGKVLASWNALTPKVKILAVVGFLAVVIGGLSGFAITASRQYVPLFAFTLSETDQKEVTNKLNEVGQPFEVVSGKIMVPPDQKRKMTGMLMNYGLPHRPLALSKDAAGMIPPSDKEKEMNRLQDLQAKLIEQMRVLNFVNDAYVEIVPADEEAALLGTAKPATAQVLLMIKPGTEPSHEQVDAIVSMVAYSVRGMAPENVKVITDQGRVLTGLKNSGPAGGQAEAPAASDELELKVAYEKQLKDKVIPDLDKILGHDRYTLSLNCDLDFSQKKIEKVTLGDEHVTSRDEKGETYTNAPKDKDKDKDADSKDKKGANEVGMSPSMMQGSTSASGTNYEKKDVKIKIDNDKTSVVEVMPAGSLRKLSASLAVDRPMDDAHKAQWEKWLKNSLGIDESRGDSVMVMDNATFASGAGAPSSSVAELMALKEQHDKTHSSGSENLLPAPIMIGIMASSLLMLLGLIAVFLMKQHKVQVDKSSLLLTTGPSATPSNIADLVNDKSGKSSAETQTTLVNNRAELEKLAKEKPTKVAELLKNTWLSEKER